MAKKTYVVKEKDNLASLSKALGVSIRELQQANGIRNLTPGQTLTVPRNDVQKTKNQAGIYTTGEGERKTVTVDGQQVRLGPNSSLDTRKPQKNKFQQFIDIITGNASTGPSGTTSVRGSLPSAPSKSFPGLASPTQYRNRLGTNTTAGGLSTQFQGFLQNFQNVMSGQYSSTGYTQQAMAPSSLSGIPLQSNNAVTSSLVLGTNMPTYYQGPGGGGQFSYAPQGQPNSYTPYKPNATYGPNFPTPVSTYRAPGQFSYAPQGQPNSYTPYGPIQPRPAPFLTAQMLANPTYNGVQPQGAVGPYTDPNAWYGRYAEGNKLYSGQAKTQQEAFQQGSIKVGKRSWIGRGKTHGEDNSALLAAQQAAQQAAMDAINMNPGYVQQTTWRPIY